MARLRDAIVANRNAVLYTAILSSAAAAFCWAFVPDAWDGTGSALAEGNVQALVTPLLLTIGGVLALAVPLWVHHHRETVLAREAEEQAGAQLEQRAELVALLQGYLKPCIEMLPAIAHGGADAPQHLGNLEQAVLNTAQTICGPTDSGVRAVRFRVDRQTLVACAWSGGSTRSERRLSNRDKGGAQAWTTAKTGEPMLYPDLVDDPPAWYEPGPTSSYGSFITCGVLSPDGSVRAMLNVDAPKPFDLDDTDRIIVGVCARVLGVGYALSDPADSV